MNLQLAKDVSLIAANFVPKSQKEGIAALIYESVEKADATQNAVLDRINTIEAMQTEILRLMNQMVNPNTDSPVAEIVADNIPEQLDAIEQDVLAVLDTVEGETVSEENENVISES